MLAKKNSLGISEVLNRLADEFDIIQKTSHGKNAKYGFKVDEVEVEIQFIAKKEGKDKVKLLVVEEGKNYPKEQIQKIKFELEPYKIKEKHEEDNKDHKKKKKDKDKKESRKKKPAVLKKTEQKKKKSKKK